MPSPIAHIAMGYGIYDVARRGDQETAQQKIGPVPRLLVLTAAMSLLPDVDSIPGVLSGEFGAFHNTISHSLILGLLVAVVAGAIARLQGRGGFWRWFWISFACYGLHVFMDALTHGSRGVMMFWPLTSERVLSPVPVFAGLHWSGGIGAVSRHLVTISTELVFAGIVVLAVRLLPKLVVRQAAERDYQDV